MAIVAARSRYQRLYPDVPTDKLVIYVTTQTHSLGLKAGLVLGLSVCTIPVRAEDNYSLRGEDFQEVIERDKAEGKHPILIGKTNPVVHARKELKNPAPVGTVGTTSSGAIDNIDEIGEIRESISRYRFLI